MPLVPRLATRFVPLVMIAAASIAFAPAAHGQTTPPAAAAPAHPAVCGAAVRVYHEKTDIPVPYDTVALPPGPPIRVTSPEEAEAAELALRTRAGSVGATGVLVTTVENDMGDGNVRMTRNVTAVYVPSEAARAAAACKAGS